VSSVDSFFKMFSGASKFSQCLSSWEDILKEVTNTTSMFEESKCPFSDDPDPTWCSCVSTTDFCVDNGDFNLGKPSKDCEWIGKKDKCDSETELECPATCNPGCLGCEDDPDFKQGGKKKKTCKWVAKKPSSRCKDDETIEACAATCDPKCETSCTDNPDYQYDGNSKKTCKKFISKKPDERCSLNNYEPFFACPASCNPKCQ